MLSYAYPTPKKKISVASLQLGKSADVGSEARRNLDVLNVVFPQVYGKFIASRQTLSLVVRLVTFVFLMH